MDLKHNYLRMYRKQLRLTQYDLAFILGMSDYANSVSKWEKGYQVPHINTLLKYHILFDIPVEAFFDRQKQDTKEHIKTKILERIEMLKEHQSDIKVQDRINCLMSIVTRLSGPAE